MKVLPAVCCPLYARTNTDWLSLSLMQLPSEGYLGLLSPGFVYDFHDRGDA